MLELAVIVSYAKEKSDCSTVCKTSLVTQNLTVYWRLLSIARQLKSPIILR